MAQLLSQVPKLGPIQPKEAFKIQASLFEKSISAADAMAHATRAQGLSYSGGKTDILTQALPAPAQARPPPHTHTSLGVQLYLLNFLGGEGEQRIIVLLPAEGELFRKAVSPQHSPHTHTRARM